MVGVLRLRMRDCAAAGIPYRYHTAHGSVVAATFKMVSGGASESRICSLDSEVRREYH